jgi:hypothetical protein
MVEWSEDKTKSDVMEVSKNAKFGAALRFEDIGDVGRDSEKLK